MPSSPDELFQPGLVLLFADATYLPEFEDVVAHSLCPEGIMGASALAWEQRVSIIDKLRPARFNGRIGNIVLSYMDDPGGEFIRQNGHNHQLETLGFDFTADAMSSGRGIIAQIQAKIWYRKQHNRHTQNNFGRVTRKVSTPVLSQDRIEHINDSSVEVAYDVFRTQLMKARPTGMTN